MAEEQLEDRLDRIVAEAADRLAAGLPVDPAALLASVPAEARPGLERCLRMLEAGAEAPGGGTPLAPGVRLGRYELVAERGRGGMASVWVARDPELRRSVALKVLRPALAVERRNVDRFRREALAIAQLRHPHVVQVFDVGTALGHAYLAMELVEGPSLASVLAALRPEPGSGPAAWSSEALARAAGIAALARSDRNLEQALAALLAPVAGALHAAHERGLVHRDVKPSNILLRADGRAVIADFGLAKDERDPALSLTGDTLGTPYYMSPEQARISPSRVDLRTDVYSLGVTLFEALGGRRPFEGATVLEVLESIRTSSPPALRVLEPRVGRDAAAVVRRAMERDPERRYASAAALEEDLSALAERRQTSARRTEGGVPRRALHQLLLATSGAPYEYRSTRTFLGLPLVHVVTGWPLPADRRRVARGWIAIGRFAVGGIACGGVCAGGITFGGLTAGLLFGFGGIAAGLVAFGGLALGAVALGGVAIGGLAIGGGAIGYGAAGGAAYGHYAIGGAAAGAHVVDQATRDPEALRFFRTFAPFALRMLYD